MSSIDIVVLTIYLYKMLHRGIFHNFYVYLNFYEGTKK